MKTLTQLLVCDDLKKAVTAGRAAYDGTSAQACLTAVASIITAEWEAAGRPALPAVAPPRPPAQRRN